MRWARATGRGLLVLIGVYLVLRALVEPFLINPFRPQSYRLDWGGPHYLGVLLVHCGPGIAMAGLALRRYRNRPRPSPRSLPAPTECAPNAQRPGTPDDLGPEHPARP